MKVIISNLILFFSTVLETLKWKKATRCVAETQFDYLMKILKFNEETYYGQKHHFSQIDSVRSFQRFVPINSYESLTPDINLTLDGKDNILTKKAVYRFGISSGSTCASKLIPYTRELSDEFQKGINPWFWYLFKRFPRICLGRTYWSISPIGQKERFSNGGIPIGFEDDEMYFTKFEQYILNTIQIAPKEISKISDVNIFRYVTLAFLLAEKNLTWISIWNPTFLTLLFSTFKDDIRPLAEDIRLGIISKNLNLEIEVEKRLRTKFLKYPTRSLEIIKILDKWEDKDFKNCDSNGQTLYEALWPRLKLISCWADGQAFNSLPGLKTLFPSVKIQPKGLIATEAFVSFPFKGKKSALSLNSHFFEFELETYNGPGPIKLAHELIIGQKYGVIVTTSGGLYRYRLNDVVKVVGFEGQCPLIRFMNKKDKVVDIMGEKLNEQFVKEVVEEILSKDNLRVIFWLVSPVQLNGQISYTIFIQNENDRIPDYQLNKLVDQIESKFLENYHYHYCRKLGQLGQLKVFSISSSNPDEIYLTTCLSFGQRLGDIKNTVLHPNKQWPTKFQGKFV